MIHLMSPFGARGSNFEQAPAIKGAYVGKNYTRMRLGVNALPALLNIQIPAIPNDKKWAKFVGLALCLSIRKLSSLNNKSSGQGCINSQDELSRVIRDGLYLKSVW